MTHVDIYNDTTLLRQLLICVYFQVQFSVVEYLICCQVVGIPFTLTIFCSVFFLAEAHFC